ncbi:MAG: hypothetical protein BGP13_22655 [Sphingobacteriales bacterium 40-81]|nr:MAG: hypothetical protein BGP13_22655 [Sphingobacteriales bacterium 40-81]
MFPRIEWALVSERRLGYSTTGNDNIEPLVLFLGSYMEMAEKMGSILFVRPIFFTLSFGKI